MTRRHATATLGALLILLSLGACGDSGSGSGSGSGSDPDVAQPQPEVLPGQPAVVEAGRNSLAIPAGEHLIDEGKGPIGFRVFLDTATDGDDIPLASGEIALASRLTLRHDQEGEIPIEGDDFARLTVAFDPTMIPPPGTPNDLNVVLKSRHPARSAEGDSPADDLVVNRVIGTVDPDAATLTVALSALPSRADLVAVYVPDLFAVGADQRATPRARTALPPWESTGVHIIGRIAELRDVVLEIEGSNDDETILRVVRERLIDNAVDSLKYYSNLGLRQPRLEVRAFDVGGSRPARRFVLHLGAFANSSYDPGATPFPQVQLEVERLAGTLQGRVGTMRAVVHHELFHAIFSGYAIKGLRDGRRNTASGFNEGLATVLGTTFDWQSDRALVRSAGEHEVYDLDRFFGNARRPYANQDPLAYFLRTDLGNDFRVLGGDTGLLEGMRARSLENGTDTRDEFYRAYQRAMNDVLQTATGGASGLPDAYSRFVRNRFYEHDAASALREGDTLRPNQRAFDRFESSEHTATVEITEDTTFTVGFLPLDDVSMAGLADLQSMSAAFINLEAGSTPTGGTFSGNLEVDIHPRVGHLGEDSLQIWAYREGESGVRLTQPKFIDSEFGEGHGYVCLLVINANLDDVAAVDFDVTATATETPPPSVCGDGTCQPDETCLECREDCANTDLIYSSCYDPPECPPIYTGSGATQWPSASNWAAGRFRGAFEQWCDYSHPDITARTIRFRAGWVEDETLAVGQQCDPIYSGEDHQVSSADRWAQVKWSSTYCDPLRPPGYPCESHPEADAQGAVDFALDLLGQIEPRGLSCGQPVP